MLACLARLFLCWFGQRVELTSELACPDLPDFHRVCMCAGERVQNSKSRGLLGGPTPVGGMSPATWNVIGRNRVRSGLLAFGSRRSATPKWVIDPSHECGARTPLDSGLGNRLPKVREVTQPSLGGFWVNARSSRGTCEPVALAEILEDDLHDLGRPFGGTTGTAPLGSLRQEIGTRSAFHHGRFWDFSSSNRRRRSIRRFTRRISRRCMPSNSRWSCRRLIRSSFRLERSEARFRRNSQRQCLARITCSMAAARA